MVARFSEQKDHASLLRALHGHSDGAWNLELIGGGPGLPSVQETTVALGLQGHIHFTGEVHDVPARLAKSSLFVLASKWEGLPRSIIEAMRAGLPIVASDVGGVHELVEDSVTGYLVPSGDVTLLRQRLQELVESPALRKEMGLAGRRRFEEQFQFETMFQKTLGVYEEVIGQPLQT
jgi:glycosyltransferase involved in cell wall biosynthesis